MITDSQNIIETLKLQNNATINIYSEENLQTITHYSYTHVTFHQNNQIYPLCAEFPLHLFLETLQKLIKRSLSNNLKLDASITHDIGYLWNEWLNNDHAPLLYITDKNNDTSWIGQQYELASHEYVSWIYNDENQNIIFEITPAYPFGCIDQQNEEELKNYTNWMQSYKPIFKTIISKETALKWIEQATQILNIVDENSKKLYIENKV